MRYNICKNIQSISFLLFDFLENLQDKTKIGWMLKGASYMKKWIGISIVLLVVVLYFLWPKASLDGPIVVSAQIDELAKTITISYITTKNDKTYLMEVAVDEKEFYPIRTDGNWDGETETTGVLITQNGYELREDVIKLTEEELTYFDKYTGGALPVDISYENYAPVETILIVLRADETAEGVVEEDRLRYTFTAPDAMSISSIGHYDSVAFLSYSQNGIEPKIPFKMEQGDTIDLFFSNPYKMGTRDSLLLEIETIEGKQYMRHLEVTAQLPDGYLKQIAEEHQ